MKANLGARLFAVQVISYYLVLARVHFTTQVEGEGTWHVQVNPPSNLFQVPALEVGTNCIKSTAELPPPGHTCTLLTSNSWLPAGQGRASSHGAHGEPG